MGRTTDVGHQSGRGREKQVVDSPWAALTAFHRGAALNWPLIGVLALDALAWAAILRVVIPLFSKTPV